MQYNKGLCINCFAATEKMGRKDNQDFFLPDGKNHLYIVADGMGGYKGGAVASKFAGFMAKNIVKTINSLASKQPDETIMPEGEDLNYEDVLKHIFLEAHNETMAKGIDDNAEGMGCTIVLLLFREERLYILNAGDCRCYRYSEETLCQLTRDHSKVEDLLRNKKISKEEARTHENRNLVKRWIGGSRFSGMPDTCSIPYYINDRFILCTDGITKVLGDAGIENFAKLENIKDAANGIISAVQTAPEEIVPGTQTIRIKDNATVMVLDVVSKIKDVAAVDSEETIR